MKRFLLSAVCVLLACHPVPAQTWEMVVADSGHYVWGEGWGRTIEEADNQALAMLSSKISLIICNEFHSVEGQYTGTGGRSSYSSIENNIHSYSSALLTNTGVVVLDKGKEAHVGRWIGREEIARIRMIREYKIMEYVSEAFRNESAGRIGDALRGYYWAYALMRANPEYSSLEFTDDYGQSHMLSGWLTEKIGSVLSNISVKVQSYTGQKAVLQLSYNGKPLSDMDFSYFDGCRWSGTVSARDSRVPLEMSYNYKPEFIHIKFEYAYMSEARLDKELELALSAIKDEPLRKSYVAAVVVNEPARVRFAGTATPASRSGQMR